MLMLTYEYELWEKFAGGFAEGKSGQMKWDEF